MVGWCHINVGGPIYSIQHGKIGWRFEMHRYCGPMVVDHRGEPKDKQPNEGSAFWRVVSLWAQQGQRVTKEGVAIFDPQ